MTTDAQPMTIRCSRCCGTGQRRIAPGLRDVLEAMIPGHWLKVSEVSARFRGLHGRSISDTAMSNRLRRLVEDGAAEMELIKTRKWRGARHLYRPKVDA